ncbi:LysR family transcriptional regulator [Enterococcus sp. HY326]|uniref:LysR family transcriptional regulator n=1 Tax=Enterococcus sp. HY326 TaxID=2971265 RepID=UPI00223F4D3B|nr:LysR family transcriptional regulator [Enterococcus sp. HY326]
MNIKQLSYFVQIYQRKNLTLASQDLFISQQGLSRSLQELESELGLLLFSREHHQMIATEAGDFLYRRALPLLAEFRQLETDIKANFSGSSQLKIAVAPGILRSLSIADLLSFQTAVPTIQLEIQHASDLSCEEKVRTGAVDLALSVNSEKISGLAKTKLTAENYFILMGQDHPCAQLADLSLADLKECNFVSFDESYRMQKNFLTMCQAAGFTPKIIFTSNETTTLAKFAIASGSLFLGVAHIVAEIKLPQLVARPLITEEKWEIVALRKTAQPAKPQISQFIEFLLQKF